MQSALVVLKRYMPISLFGRALLILVLPIVLLQVLVASLLVQRHYDSVTEQMAGSIARELNYAVRALEEAPDVEGAERALARMSGPLGFELVLDPGAQVEPAPALRRFYDITGVAIAETLHELVHHPLAVDLVSYEKHVAASIGTNKGALRVLVPRRRMNASNPHQLLVWISVSALLLTVIAMAFLRNQVRPIRELARAAQAFGRGHAVSFRPAGAEEVRRAGAAFLDMRTRIERHVEQRTRMLSGVSHDLRTPLTRMKLALAVADETPETAEIARDIVEMEHMLAGFLAFARGEGGEPVGPASPVDLAEEVAADARRQGASVQVFAQLETPDAPMVEMRRRALKRGIANLVENAASYARRVALSVRLTRRFAEFVVEDDGPGIPEDKRDEVLKPFIRLDEARNQDIPGTGLGLSIALDIARSHGGSLKLDESPRLGGLRATLLVPR
jgi:two-component system, OmpR family, osmolarity sensor histidine kinase EnvZ